MRAAPPARRICRKTAVSRPEIALVIIKHVKLTDILRITDCLERAHVLAAGKNKRAADRGVHAENALRGEFLFIKLRFDQTGFVRLNKVTPDNRRIADAFCFAGRHTAGHLNFEVVV